MRARLFQTLKKKKKQSEGATSTTRPPACSPRNPPARDREGKIEAKFQHQQHLRFTQVMSWSKE